MLIQKQKTKVIINNHNNDSDALFERKIENATEGLSHDCFNWLERVANSNNNKENVIVIANYIMSMKTEINLSDNYRRAVIILLSKFSIFFKNQKSFKSMTREDMLKFLDSFRKPESVDTLHKWIGTYNTYRIYLMRFFKWLYSPDIEPDKRPKPSVIENIPQLKRKERSIYKPTDLWVEEDDSLFLEYCPSKRIKCYHAVSRDSSARPHEILKLKIKDIVFKFTPDKKQYAEILLNGKTGSRHIPLFNSIPYIKDYLDHEHPQSGNPNAPFICGVAKSLGRPIRENSLLTIYDNYKKECFPKLLESPNVSPEDKQKIRELLKKPWNLYIRRHSALTEKSTILKEHVLRQHAGWSPSSQMHLKYLHYFGNESNDSLLEAYGVVTKDKKLSDVLKPKQCPNCNESNKPDSKFCAKCRMVLTYDAYNETVEEKTDKENEIQRLKEQMISMQDSQKEILGLLKDPSRLIEILRES
ncbi:MAG: zinc ribbon domain-containing protein [Thermoproteota archaeon]|nr:zinc ribbon domain-containing protein [Thermoproteota archaeon]